MKKKLPVKFMLKWLSSKHLGKLVLQCHTSKILCFLTQEYRGLNQCGFGTVKIKCMIIAKTVKGFPNMRLAITHKLFGPKRLTSDAEKPFAKAKAAGNFATRSFRVIVGSV